MASHPPPEPTLMSNRLIETDETLAWLKLDDLHMDCPPPKISYKSQMDL
jgi:hypothetical protein